MSRACITYWPVEVLREYIHGGTQRFVALPQYMRGNLHESELCTYVQTSRLAVQLIRIFEYCIPQRMPLYPHAPHTKTHEHLGNQNPNFVSVHAAAALSSSSATLLGGRAGGGLKTTRTHAHTRISTTAGWVYCAAGVDVHDVVRGP